MAHGVWCWELKVVPKSLEVPKPTVLSHLLEDFKIHVLGQKIRLKFGSFCHPSHKLTLCYVSKPRLDPAVLAKIAKLLGRVIVVFKEHRVETPFGRRVGVY